MAAAAEGGRLKSFLAVVFLLGCTAAVLTADGAAAGFEDATFAVAVVETFVIAAAGLVKVDAGRDVEEPAADLVFDEAGPAGLVAVDVLGFGAAEGTGRVVAVVVFGLAPLAASAAGLLAAPLGALGLVPLVTVALGKEVVLTGATGLLSGALVWFLAVVETAATPTGLLGAPDVFDVDPAAFLSAGPAEEGLTSFCVRCVAVPGRDLDPGTPEEEADWLLLPVALDLTLGSTVKGFSLEFWVATGAGSS